MTNSTILVTGGAGYIGSHIVLQLVEAGYEVIVYDNCSTGSADAVMGAKLIQADLADRDRLYQVFANYPIQAVIHLAAKLVVPESIVYPLDYYSNNTCNTLTLLRCCQTFGVNQLIFSSTAAVYGEPQQNPVPESAPTHPINPYGKSKLMSEWLIQDYAAISPLRYLILRYFNVAGADPLGRIGPSGNRADHLIKIACDTALGRRASMTIFGNDFPTPDGTGVRDYIHVQDLAAAHLQALRYLQQGGKSQILNCGYGQGYSVQQVIDQVKALSGVDFPVMIGDRRPGDPAYVTACAQRIRTELSWCPQYDDLETMIQTALSWEKKHHQNILQKFTVNLQKKEITNRDVIHPIQATL